MKRALLIAAITAGVLVALYAAAGYWLAPRFIHVALVDRGREAGLDVRVEKISTHPFALSVELHDVRISALKGGRLLYVQRVVADLSAASAYSRAWVMQSVALENPVLTALPAAAPKRGSGATLPRIEVREASISSGVVQIAGQPRISNIALALQGLSTLDGDAAAYEASATIDAGGRVRSKGSLHAAPLAAQGTLELRDAALASAWRFLPSSIGEAPPGTIDASLTYRVANGRFSVSDLKASAVLPSGGTLRASGEMELVPFRATLGVEGEKLPLALLQPLIEGRAAARIASGTLSGKGHLQVGGNDAGYEGSLALAGTRVVDVAGELLLAWQRLQSQQVVLQFSPFSVEVATIAAQAPRARVVIDAQGGINLAKVLTRREGGGSGERPQIQVGQVRIADGRIDFTDRSLPSPFGTTARELAGTIAGISTTPGKAAHVRLDGRVGEYGDAVVRGTVDLDAPSELTNLNARLRNLALPDFTPYAAKFAGYRIEGGRLDAELRYRVTGGRLVGTNQLVFRDLKLGEKIESASALDLPIELAVALLTDSEGRINLAIPVSGNLNDPQFDVGGLIAKALGNTLRKIVSAPFRLLASLVRGEDDSTPQAVRFDPGSTRLSPPEEETVATLAKALAERPRLELAIHPGYDADADAKALRREIVLSQLAGQTGSARAAAGASRAANAGDPKITAAAERLYRARGASAADIARLEPKRPGYGRRLIDELAPAVVLDPAALPVLAQSRARAVRQALVEHGAQAERVAIDSARETQTGEGGVPTQFELRAR